MLKKFEKLDKSLIAFVIVIFIISCFFFWLGCNKDIWFCDEVYTYMSANESDKVNPLKASEWTTGGDMTAYLAATPGESTHFKFIADKLYTDHVPLYFWLFRIFSMLAAGSASKWVGLSLNYVFFIILCYILKKFFEKNDAGTDQQIVIGLMILTVMFHPIVLSEATTIRMYLMFSVFQIGFLYILDHRRNDLRYSISLWLVTTLGLLTHFYLWIWLAIFSMCYVLYLFFLLYRKEICFKDILYYIEVMFFSLLATTIVFHQWIKNIFFTHDKGNIAFTNIFHLRGIHTELQSALSTLTDYLSVSKWALLPGILVFAALILMYLLSKRSNYKIWLMIISSIIYSFFVVHTQPTAEGRYLWPACVLILAALPEIIVTDVEFLCRKVKTDLAERYKNIMLICILAILSVAEVKADFDFSNIAYLQLRTKEEYLHIAETADHPWLVFYSYPFSWQFFCSIYDFRLPEQVKRVDLDAAGSYDAVIENASELIVYTMDDVKSIEECMDYINGSCTRNNCRYEKIGTSYQMSVYRITWE